MLHVYIRLQGGRTAELPQAPHRWVTKCSPSSMAATHSLTLLTRLPAKCSMSARRCSRSSLQGTCGDSNGSSLGQQRGHQHPFCLAMQPMQSQKSFTQAGSCAGHIRARLHRLMYSTAALAGVVQLLHQDALVSRAAAHLMMLCRSCTVRARPSMLPLKAPDSSA
jgi:hypothetical protein